MKIYLLPPGSKDKFFIAMLILLIIGFIAVALGTNLLTAVGVLLMVIATGVRN
jgi:hypothetical protein